MNNATQENVVFGLNKKSKMSLAYKIAGFYSDENIIGSKNWHSLMWSVFGQVGKTYSNDPSDPRSTFTSVDNDKIRNIQDISDFEEAYPEVAKIAKSKADLFSDMVNNPERPLPSNGRVKGKAITSVPTEDHTLHNQASIEQRMLQIEETLGLIASKLK